MLDQNVNKAQFSEVELFKIIAFFDLFNFPLSLMEIKINSGFEGEITYLVKVLERLVTSNKIATKSGFYFLVARENILEIRRERYNYSLRKIKIARQFARIFALFPSVLTIYLVNSIGPYNLRDNSDIDFFIITKKNRIWLSRLFCAGLAKILHKRPNQKTKRDKICLSFYLSEDNLDLSKLKLEASDPYFDYWERNLYLLFDKKGGAHERLIKENNLEDFYDKIAARELGKKKESRSFLSILVDHLEKMSQKFQLKIMPEKLLLAANLPGEDRGVIISDDIIKLYLRDRRLDIKKKYEQKIR